MSSNKKFVRLTRTLPVDPALGLTEGTVWPVCPPPNGGNSMRTWIMSSAGREVALLRHEWEEAATVILDPCPHCGHDAHVIPAVKRGLFIAECVQRSACSVYPMTEALPSEVEASDAWNSRRFATETTAPALAE